MFPRVLVRGNPKGLLEIVAVSFPFGKHDLCCLFGGDRTIINM